MLIVFLLLALFNVLKCIPLTNNQSGIDASLDTPIEDYLLPRSNITVGRRETADIIISCLATILACTWTAMHPNIPSPTDSGWATFKRRFMTMIYALLAPEAITAWALRQNIIAGNIQRSHNSNFLQLPPPATPSLFERLRRIVMGWFSAPPLPAPLIQGKTSAWTLTHGFFLQMGGFMLCKCGVPIQTLAYSGDNFPNIYWLLENGYIDPPHTTENEIHDRSKGDFLSKAIVVLQTTWFVAQCIARWSTSLPVTELEVVTLGFAVLNGITYWLWWNKPQSVGVPVYLELKVPLPVEDPVAPQATIEQELSASDRALSALEFAAQVQAILGLHDSQSRILTHVKILLEFVVSGLIRPFAKLVGTTSQKIQKGDLRVPMFYPDSLESQNNGFFPAWMISVVFGSVHLAPAWFLDFPTRSEMWLWRVCAIIITGLPGAFSLGVFILRMSGESEGSWPRFMSLIARMSSFPFRPFFYTLARSIIMFLTSLYILARIILLALALSSLRQLPPGAFVTIQWLSIIPHL